VSIIYSKNKNKRAPDTGHVNKMYSLNLFIISAMQVLF